MKIRNGFVSNSSSSSFIIDSFKLYNYETKKDWNKNTIKEEVINIYTRWLKNRRRNIKRDAVAKYNHWKEYLDNYTIEDAKQALLDWYDVLQKKLNDLPQNLYVDTVKKIKSIVKKEGCTTLEYWYPGKDLKKENIVIFDPCNYLPDEVNNLIAKRFEVKKECRNHHMG